MTESRVIGQLTADGLSNIVLRQPDFAFVFDGDEVRCSRFHAQFISPTVCSLMQNDPTIDRLDLEFQTQHKSVIQLFLSQLLDGGRIDFPVSDISVLADFVQFLGNRELLELFAKGRSDPVDESNVVQRLKLFPTEPDISFFATRFSSVCEQPAIDTLSFELISRILSDSELRLESEDSLFRFIESLCSKNDAYRDLIEYVEAQYLSEMCISDYISFVDPDRLSRGTWLSICRRLSLPVSPSTVNPRLNVSIAKVPTVTFGGDQSSMFRGIFDKLREECKGNPHLCGKVKVSANDERSDRTFQVHDLIWSSDKSGKWWGTHSTDIEHFIKFEFPSSRICPSGYSLKAHSSIWTSGSLIRSWRFEGSNDDSRWTTLDTQTDSDAIAGTDKEAFFPISSTEAYRFLRIMTRSPTSSGNHQFSMQQIELFGQIHPSPSL
jgi:hypothetical protein